MEDRNNVGCSFLTDESRKHLSMMPLHENSKSFTFEFGQTAFEIGKEIVLHIQDYFYISQRPPLEYLDDNKHIPMSRILSIHL